MADRAEIFAGLANIVSQVTLTDESTIKETSQLFDDLGVESIDFIDIIYNMETRFGLEISNDSIFTDREFFSSHMENGELSQKGVETLRGFGYLNMEKVLGAEGPQYAYSMEMLVDYIEYRLKTA